MKYIRKLRALIVLAGLCAACATVPTAPPVAVTFGHCVSDAARKEASSLLSRVMTALATGDYESQLATLGVKFGGVAVGCAVDIAIDQLNGMHAASPDPVVATMSQRAHDWREDHQ